MRGRCVTALVASACTHSPSPPPPTGEVVIDNINVTGLALDGTFLYWTSPDGQVAKWPLDGSGDAIALVSGLQTRPMRLAIDSGFVYWTNIGSLTSPADGGVMKVPIAGGMATTLTTGYQAESIAIGSTSVYWADHGAVRSIPKLGGSIQTMFDSHNFLEEVGALAVDASFIYWNANGPERQPLDGGAPSKWDFGGVEGPGSLVVSPTNVYWTVGQLPCDVTPCGSNHQGYVMTAPLNGGATVMLAMFRTPSYPVTPMAIDATHVYWMTADSVQRVALDGSGTVETLAEHQGDPHALALGDTNVYWASGPVGEFPAAVRVVSK